MAMELFIEEQELEKPKSENLDGLLEEYYNLGFEDIIGKDIYTRFKYTKVKKFDFGLSNEDILLLNDKELNKLVSLRKYKPYRTDEELTNMHRIKNLKQKLKKRIEDEKKQLKKVLKQDIELQKEKLLGVKGNAKQEKSKLVREAKLKEKKQEINDGYKEKAEKDAAAGQPATGKRDRKSLYHL
jgi:hypothetical protein